jgi:hypothetical protein
MRLVASDDVNRTAARAAAALLERNVLDLYGKKKKSEVLAMRKKKKKKKKSVETIFVRESIASFQWTGSRDPFHAQCKSS